MKVYLVRHAQSSAHGTTKRQAPETPLGETGQEQAQKLAERLLSEKIDSILVSKWQRAKETGEIISQKLGKDPLFLDDLREKEQNPSLYGADLESELQKRYIGEVRKYGVDMDWKFEDKGESLRELVERVKKFKSYLWENHGEEDVLIVTHGLFIRTFVILALLGEEFDDKAFSEIFMSITLTNTGITHLEYEPEREHWELLYFNDSAHLRG